MRLTRKLIVSFAIVAISLPSCNSSTEGDGDEPTEREEVLAVDTTITIDDEIAEDLLNLDSIADIFGELEMQYNDQQDKLIDRKEELYIMDLETFDEYSGRTEIWYFDKNFNLIYNEMDFGAEGGYSELAFCCLKNNQPWLMYFEESDVDNPTTMIRKYDKDGILLLSAGRKIDYYNNEEKSYFIPNRDDYDYSYQFWLEKQLSSVFTPGKKYTYEDSKMVDGEYGETLVGYKLAIDSVLFQKLYNLK